MIISETHSSPILSRWLDVCLVATALSDSLQLYGLQPTRLLCLWGNPLKNSIEGCLFFLLRILLTQGSNSYFLYFLHCRQILYLTELIINFIITQLPTLTQLLKLWKASKFCWCLKITLFTSGSDELLSQWTALRDLNFPVTWEWAGWWNMT